MRKAHSELFSLDVLALSLLCCLLASVVGILVLSGEGVNLRERVVLRKHTTELVGLMDETRRSLEEISGKLQYSALERENRIARGKVEELERKIDARQRLAEARSEIERLNTQLASLKHHAPGDNVPNNPFGSYRGRFILVECVRDHVLIYPGRERLGLQPTPDQIATLINRIRQAGFVLFVVRPSGWYDNSFNKVQPLVNKGLDQASGGQAIGRAVLPLAESASLAPYMPPSQPGT